MQLSEEPKLQMMRSLATRGLLFNIRFYLIFWNLREMILNEDPSAESAERGDKEDVRECWTSRKLCTHKTGSGFVNSL